MHQHDSSSGPSAIELLSAVLSSEDARARPDSPAEWTALAREAERSGLCGLVLERVASLGCEAPRPIVDRLRAGSARVAAEELNITHELERVLGAFQEMHIPVLLLKGAALLTNVYARPGLRPMGDIDLVVRPDQVARAATALERSDCRPGADLLHDDFFPRFHYETEWITQSPRPVRIDLHVRPFRPLRAACTVPEDALWFDAVRVSVGAAHAWIPAPEPMFVHLCAHAAYHGCSRLIWLYDIHRFAEFHAGRIDWTRVLELCRSWRMTLPVRIAIRKCEASVGAVCPAHVTDALGRRRVSWRDHLVTWQAPHDSERPVLHVLANAVTTPDLRLAARYLRACLSPDRTHLGASYPWRHRGWAAVATLWRAVRAAARACTSLVTPVRRLGHSG